MSIWEVSNKIVGGGPSSTGPFYNIMHVSVPNDDPATATAITGLFTTFYTAIKGIFTTASSLQPAAKIVRVDVDPAVYIPNTPGSVAGTQSVTWAPAQICMVLSWRTAIATRHGRGRTYLGPLGAATLSGNGDLSAALALAAQNAGTALIAGVKSFDAAAFLAVWQRPKRNAGGTIITPGHATPILTASCSGVSYTQRRRAA